MEACKSKKMKKLKKKFWPYLTLQDILLGGPLTRFGGQILENASIKILIFMRETSMPNFMEIGQVVSSARVLGLKKGNSSYK